MTYIASIDAGNGGVNAVLAKQSGGHKTTYFPSVRAVATGESLGLGSQFDMEYEYYDWSGQRYIVGDDVLRITRRHLERHMGIQRYGNEFHQFLVAVALAKLGIKDGDVDLVMFAPPGAFKEMRPRIQERFMSDEGLAQIKLRSDKKLREWRYGNIIVLPEGIGAACCFILDERGEFVNDSVLEGEIVIIDIGAYTLDIVQMSQGNFNAESLEHATWEKDGVDEHIRQPILRMLKAKSEDFSVVTVDDVDFVIRQGALTGNYELTVAGLTLDLKPALDKLSESYAGWIANTIIDTKLNALNGLNGAILVGGGETLVERYLREWYGSKIIDRKKHPTTRKIHPAEFNAVGGLRYAMAARKEA
jgi:hypothetical protein